MPSRIEIKMSVLQDICEWTRQAFDKKYKPEQIGFLLGTVEPGGRVMVTRAALYGGGVRTMYGVTYDAAGMLRARRNAARRFRLRALGLFHSHVEIAGRAEYGLSEADRDTFAEDEEALVEAVVAVREADRVPKRTSKKVLCGFDREDAYAYNIRVYGRTRPGIRLLPVKAGR
jgi:proteasome lid subunit RPN8/RPN11